MEIIKNFDTEEKLKILGELARFEPTSPFYSSFNLEKYYNFIYPAVGAKGKICNLFKVLQTNLCKYNCFYCANRLSRDTYRVSFTPKELAKVFLQFYRKQYVDGLFLSSGIYPDSNKAQENIFLTLKIIRDAGFKGYIHTVILPGVDNSLIKEIGKLSNRLSLNLEAPKEEYLREISPDKKFQDGLLKDLKRLSLISKNNALNISLSTQLVVGATEESDRDILSLAQKLYKELSLKRIYYSGFIPVKNTPFRDKKACPNIRETRLYQADFLIREYGFKKEELIFNKNGTLLENIDPKLAWALFHKEFFPIEINSASIDELLRVPGIGKISAYRIIKLRKEFKISKIEELKKIGVVIKRAINFITIGGKFYALKKNLYKKPEFQYSLFEYT